MGLWNRQIAPAVPKDGKQLAEALKKACNRRILCHLQQLNEESDPGRSLELMTASGFEDMARQSCRAVSEVVVKTMQEIRRQAEEFNGQTLPSCSTTRNEIVTALAPCLCGFERALESYARGHDGFKRLLAETKGGLVGRSVDAGYQGAALGDRLFGPLGALVGGLVSGLWLGKATQKTVEAEGERLDHAFREMLGAWDEAMAALMDGAFAIIGRYAENL